MVQFWRTAALVRSTRGEIYTLGLFSHRSVNKVQHLVILGQKSQREETRSSVALLVQRG